MRFNELLNTLRLVLAGIRPSLAVVTTPISPVKQCDKTLQCKDIVLLLTGLIGTATQKQNGLQSRVNAPVNAMSSSNINEYYFLCELTIGSVSACDFTLHSSGVANVNLQICDISFRTHSTISNMLHSVKNRVGFTNQNFSIYKKIEGNKVRLYLKTIGTFRILTITPISGTIELSIKKEDVVESELELIPIT